MKRALRLVAGAAALALAGAGAAHAAANVPPPPPADDSTPPRAAPAPAPKSKAPTGPCVNCAVIRNIRMLETERATRRDMPTYMTSPEYSNTRQYSPAYVGPVLGITFGPGQETKTYVGAAGSQAMRQRILQISYEVLLRYDDGRSGLVEVEDASNFRVGDRVKVVDNQLELLPPKE